MATVIVEVQIKVVPDELAKQLYKKIMETGDDLVEIPELAGICLHDVMGVSRGGKPLDLSGLLTRIIVAASGETPTGVIILRKGDPILIKAPNHEKETPYFMG